MKKLILSSLLTLGLLSCRKDIRNIEKSICGTWEIEKRMSEAGVISYPPGNGKIISISPNGSYEWIENGNSIYKGTYSLKRKKDCYSEKKEVVFITNAPNNTPLYTRIENGKLIFNTPNCYSDQTVTIYNKLQ